MGLVIGAALFAPVLLVLRRRRFAIDLPRVLLVTIATTLLATTLALTLMLTNVDDTPVFFLIFFVGAPCVAIPIAAVAASSMVRAPGYGIAAALTGLAGWVLGIVVLGLIAFLHPQAHGMFWELMVLLSIPASYAATCAVYAVALGKRRT